jgi:hypothetical protein
MTHFNEHESELDMLVRRLAAALRGGVMLFFISAVLSIQVGTTGCRRAEQWDFCDRVEPDDIDAAKAAPPDEVFWLDCGVCDPAGAKPVLREFFDRQCAGCDERFECTFQPEDCPTDQELWSGGCFTHDI